MKVKPIARVKAITAFLLASLFVESIAAAVLGTYGRTNPTTNVVPNNFELLGTPGSGGIDTEAHLRIAARDSAFGNYRIVGGLALRQGILANPKGWTASFRVKAGAISDGKREVNMEVRDDKNNWLMYLFNDGLYADLSGAEFVPAKIFDLDPSTDYHTYQMVMDPDGDNGKGHVNVYVDAEAVATITRTQAPKSMGHSALLRFGDLDFGDSWSNYAFVEVAGGGRGESGQHPFIVEQRDTSTLPIKVLHPQRLGTSQLPAHRTPLGKPGDYKPWIIQCKNGELLAVAMDADYSVAVPRKPYYNHALFWRSTDGGNTWGPREARADLAGKEFAITCLSDGTLLMTAHIMGQDVNNKLGGGRWYSKIFRSTDHGRTWSEAPIGWDDEPIVHEGASDRNVVEMPDPGGSGKTTVVLGVCKGRTAEHTRLWRSWDSGMTWDKTFKPDTQGWDDVDGFFSNSVIYRMASGRLLHTVRVDDDGPYYKVPDLRKTGSQTGDSSDRTMLWVSDDNGATWNRHGKYGTFGGFGEMYFRFLRLKDERLLCTFTVRSMSTDGQPMGLRAVLSYDDGQTWNFDNDRLVLEYQTPGRNGGHFGNTIQVEDGSLVSIYSYRGPGGYTHVEAMRWRLPEPPGSSP
jgi:hypothetical protein